jgi:hypothetical protein
MLAYLAKFLGDLFWTSWSSVKTACRGDLICVAPMDLNLKKGQQHQTQTRQLDKTEEVVVVVGARFMNHPRTLI